MPPQQPQDGVLPARMQSPGTAEMGRQPDALQEDFEVVFPDGTVFRAPAGSPRQLAIQALTGAQGAQTAPPSITQRRTQEGASSAERFIADPKSVTAGELGGLGLDVAELALGLISPFKAGAVGKLAKVPAAVKNAATRIGGTTAAGATSAAMRGQDPAAAAGWNTLLQGLGEASPLVRRGGNAAAIVAGLKSPSTSAAKRARTAASRLQERTGPFRRAPHIGSAANVQSGIDTNLARSQELIDAISGPGGSSRKGRELLGTAGEVQAKSAGELLPISEVDRPITSLEQAFVDEQIEKRGMMPQPSATGVVKPPTAAARRKIFEGLDFDARQLQDLRNPQQKRVKGIKAAREVGPVSAADSVRGLFSEGITKKAGDMQRSMSGDLGPVRDTLQDLYAMKPVSDSLVRGIRGAAIRGAGVGGAVGGYDALTGGGGPGSSAAKGVGTGAAAAVLGPKVTGELADFLSLILKSAPQGKRLFDIEQDLERIMAAGQSPSVGEARSTPLRRRERE